MTRGFAAACLSLTPRDCGGVTRARQPRRADTAMPASRVRVSQRTCSENGFTTFAHLHGTPAGAYPLCLSAVSESLPIQEDGEAGLSCSAGGRTPRKDPGDTGPTHQRRAIATRSSADMYTSRSSAEMYTSRSSADKYVALERRHIYVALERRHVNIYTG